MEPSWAIFEDLGAILGPSWVILGHLGDLGAMLKPCWAILGSSWGHLAPTSGHLGPSWDHLGAILGNLGAKVGSGEVLPFCLQTLGPSSDPKLQTELVLHKICVCRKKIRDRSWSEPHASSS